MTLLQAVNRVNYTLRALDDDAPTSGSDEWNYWLDTFNRKIEELYEDAGRQWASIYAVESLGTISASAAPTFDAPDNLVCPSDSAYVITTDDKRVDFTIIKPQERDPNVRAVFLSDLDPQTLTFTDEILATENIVGGTLYLPGYYKPDELTAPTDTIPVPDPNWLVMATAAEIAFSDIVYEDRAEALNTKANALWKQMVNKNRKGTYNNPRTIPYSVKRIRDTRTA